MRGFRKAHIFRILVFVLMVSFLRSNPVYPLRVPIDKEKNRLSITEEQLSPDFNQDPHYLRMDQAGTRFTHAVENPKKTVLSSLDKLSHAVNIDAKELFPQDSTIVVAGFGELWQELILLADTFPQCRIVGIDWLERNITLADPTPYTVQLVS